VTSHYASRNFQDLCTDSGRTFGNKSEWEFKLQLRQSRKARERVPNSNGEPHLSLLRTRTPSRGRDCFFNQGPYCETRFGNFSEVSNRVDNRLRYTPASSIGWEMRLRQTPMHNNNISIANQATCELAKAFEPHENDFVPAGPRFLKARILPEWAHLCSLHGDQNIVGWAACLRGGIKSDASLRKLHKRQDSLIESDPKLLYLSRT
jgi:hypothetical protein